MSHSENHVGLQQHSVGEIYPWTIRGVGDTLQGFHTITGEEGPRFSYANTTDTDRLHLAGYAPKGAFFAAHRLAELWVEKQRIGLDTIDAARLADAIREEKRIAAE